MYTNAIALLLLRLVLGATLIAHGIQKFTVTTIAGVEEMFTGLGVPAPAIAAPAVASIEIVAGALLVIGLATRIAAALGAVIAAVALFTVHLSSGFFVGEGGYEFVLLLAVVGIALALTGPGAFSVDGPIRSSRRKRRA
jgi:putative oxidoreductase